MFILFEFSVDTLPHTGIVVFVPPYLTNAIKTDVTIIIKYTMKKFKKLQLHVGVGDVGLVATLIDLCVKFLVSWKLVYYLISMSSSFSTQIHYFRIFSSLRGDWAGIALSLR